MRTYIYNYTGNICNRSLYASTEMYKTKIGISAAMYTCTIDGTNFMHDVLYYTP